MLSKMTKSYLLESDSYLKTSSKSSPLALSGEEVLRTSNRNSSIEQHQMSISSEFTDCPPIKPLVLHNVPSNVPPIAFVNGNCVRPVRSRHYSQLQTAIPKKSLEDLKQSNVSNGDAKPCPKQLSPRATKSQVNSQLPQEELVSSIHVPDLYSTCNQQTENHVANSDRDSSFFSDYDNSAKVIENLAKGIEGVLRAAKESRRLICTELLVPQMLMTQIAANVIELAECEPCGLRGCLLLVSIEERQNGEAGNKQSSSDSQHSNSGQSIRLLGEFAIDRSVVPTFKVFLTLKRAAPNWFESLENKLLGKERVVLSELYLLNKKKLYQPSSPTL